MKETASTPNNYFTIEVRVIPNAKKDAVEMKDGRLVCRVSVPAENGKANERLIELMADFFCCRKKDVELISGKRSRDKVLLIKSEECLKKN